ncbi:MAG: YggS family pyridoxal phosphate-dependent enzyme [Proteobacteria bacterium]|nr:YggS family pyridoxal phosphate-dependent enzyme [Pseudomonadota bacterium]
MSGQGPPCGPPVDLAANLAEVEARIAAAAKAAGRQASDVTLVAVGKGHGAERIAAALRAGHRVFGENRVQEAAAKWPPLKARFTGIELHLVGALQTNKAGDAVTLFDVIETLDRMKLARALAKEMARAGRRLPCFIQVNTGEEPQKSGVMPGDADAFIAACIADLGLPVVGLMCLPPADEEPSLHFALLADIARRHGLGRLSFGMTADYEIAVRFGATHVRVGTAIFGERVSAA